MISGFKEVSRNEEGMKKRKKNKQMMKDDGDGVKGTGELNHLQSNSERQRQHRPQIQGESSAARYARERESCPGGVKVFDKLNFLVDETEAAGIVEN